MQSSSCPPLPPSTAAPTTCDDCKASEAGERLIFRETGGQYYSSSLWDANGDRSYTAVCSDSPFNIISKCGKFWYTGACLCRTSVLLCDCTALLHKCSCTSCDCKCAASGDLHNQAQYKSKTLSLRWHCRPSIASFGRRCQAGLRLRRSEEVLCADAADAGWHQLLAVLTRLWKHLHGHWQLVNRPMR